MPKVAYNIYPTLLNAFAWMKKSEEDDAEKEFLDKVNRVEVPPTDAMLRGIAFEAHVDAIASGMMKPPTAPVLIHDVECPAEILVTFGKRFRGAVRQIEVEAFLDTMYGRVRVYGKMDEVLMDAGYDVKTTSKYEFPKYLRNFQHLVYLEALRPLRIDQMIYAVTDFRDTYDEPYSWTAEGRDRLVDACTDLIEYLEARRGLITDRKVFGLEEVAAAG